MLHMKGNKKYIMSNITKRLVSRSSKRPKFQPSRWRCFHGTSNQHEPVEKWNHGTKCPGRYTCAYDPRRGFESWKYSRSSTLLLYSPQATLLSPCFSCQHKAARQQQKLNSHQLPDPLIAPPLIHLLNFTPQQTITFPPISINNLCSRIATTYHALGIPNSQKEIWTKIEVICNFLSIKSCIKPLSA